MPKILIAPTTAAATATFDIDNERDLPTTIIAGGLTGSEVIDIMIDPGDGTHIDYYSENAKVTLSATNNAIALHAPGKYKIDKPTTAGTTQVGRSTFRRA